MGGQSSKNDDTVGALKVFDSDEIREIKSLFLRIAENHPAASLTHLQNHLRPILPSDVVKRCFTSMVKLSKGHQNAVTLQGFSVYLTHILKGTAAEKAEIVLALASDSDQVSDSSLLQFFSQLVSSYIKTIEKGKQFQSWKFSQEDRWVNSFSLYLLQDLLKSEESTTESAVFRPDEVELWLSRCPLAIHVLDVVFHSSFNIHQSEEVASRYLTPLLPSINVDWSTMQTILDVPSLIMLCHNLPAELRTQWRPLYSNGKHGDSFSQLLTRVIKQGPTVLVVRDKDGHVFGGFSSVAWDVRPQFVGSPTCFLFSLSPKFDVFTTTGYNDHYMYLNNGVQTMPNGLGMGGQLDYFGLWIDQSFNVGHSKAGPRCTTYGSPQLSKSAEFEVDVIEVWGVGPEPKREEKEGEVSILDKDPEGKAMLSLIDRGPVSEGLREADATAGSPSEHELPPL